jgi:hypothetical protein
MDGVRTRKGECIKIMHVLHRRVQLTVIQKKGRKGEETGREHLSCGDPFE